MRILTFLFTLLPTLRAQTPPSTIAPDTATEERTVRGAPVVLHLALLKSRREHINFEIAQSRLRLANPDRRIVTLVRRREYADVDGRPRDLSLEALDQTLRTKLIELDRPIELAYVQMNDFSFMHEAWRALERGGPTPARNPILALRDRLAPDARVVIIGHNFLGLHSDEFAGRAKLLLEYLGAPGGSLIAQITPTLLPYENTDFAANPGRRLIASSVKGFGAAALHQLGVHDLGVVDAVTLPAVALGAAALYHRTIPRPASPDTEVKPRMFPYFNNIDDVLFTAAVAVGTSAFAHGFFHLGTKFLNPAYVQHGVIASGVFFALSLLPKFAHNLHVRYVERTRHRNGVKLYTTAEEAAGEALHANDPRTFSCVRDLTSAM